MDRLKKLPVPFLNARGRGSMLPIKFAFKEAFREPPRRVATILS